MSAFRYNKFQDAAIMMYSIYASKSIFFRFESQEETSYKTLLWCMASNEISDGQNILF